MSSFGGMTMAEWTDAYINQLGGKGGPTSKVGKTFYVANFRDWLEGQGHPGWHQASMFLQCHKWAQRWGYTTYMLRCPNKGRDAYWIVSDHNDAKAALVTKTDQLSREWVNDMLARAVRLAQGNSTFSGDPATLVALEHETKFAINAWNFMRSNAGLRQFDANKTWDRSSIVLV